MNNELIMIRRKLIDLFVDDCFTAEQKNNEIIFTSKYLLNNIIRINGEIYVLPHNIKRIILTQNPVYQIHELTLQSEDTKDWTIIPEVESDNLEDIIFEYNLTG